MSSPCRVKTAALTNSNSPLASSSQIGEGAVSASSRNRVSLSLSRDRALRSDAPTAAMNRPTRTKFQVAAPPMASSTPSRPVAVSATIAQPPPVHTASAVKAPVQPAARAARVTAGNRMVKPVTSPYSGDAAARIAKPARATPIPIKRRCVGEAVDRRARPISQRSMTAIRRFDPPALISSVRPTSDAFASLEHSFTPCVWGDHP